MDDIKALVADGAQIDEKDDGGLTPLHFAAAKGHLEIVTYLVETCKAKVGEKNADGWAPLHFAAQEGNLKIIQYFVEKRGVNAHEKESNGLTALHIASSQGHLDIVQYLIKNCRGAVDEKNNIGWTPLYIAVASGHLEVMQFLISMGAQINAPPLILVSLRFADPKPEIIAFLQEVVYWENLQKNNNLHVNREHREFVVANPKSFASILLRLKKIQEAQKASPLFFKTIFQSILDKKTAAEISQLFKQWHKDDFYDAQSLTEIRKFLDGTQNNALESLNKQKNCDVTLCFAQDSATTPCFVQNKKRKNKSI